MQQNKNFGRRTPANDTRPTPPWIPKLIRSAEAARTPPVPSPTTSDEVPDVDGELEEWKATRRKQRRGFREPWRTLSIALTLGFGASFWLLPDSVADVVQYVTGGLAAATFFMGLRGKSQDSAAPTAERIEPRA